MIEGHAVGAAPASVVTGDAEVLKAQSPHGVDLLDGHLALGVRCVVGRGGRPVALAVAGEVGRHHGEGPGQQRRHRVPHDVALGIAVQEKQRGTTPADAGEDLTTPRGVERPGLKAFEHRPIIAIRWSPPT